MKSICLRSNLRNESDVEFFFIAPLLKLLGYSDSQIKNKKSLKELGVRKSPRGKASNYRPDFLVTANASIQFIVEAKSPSENIEDWLWQPKGYAVILNSEHKNANPVQYYVICNGLETRVYGWDYDRPLYRKFYNEMLVGSPAIDELRDMLSPGVLKTSTLVATSKATLLELSKPNIEDINEAFARCHQLIYKTDNISQSAAFFEFVKIIALKLISDKHIRDSFGLDTEQDKFTVDASKIKFSLAWIEAQEQNSVNPLSDIWFKTFIDSMEKDIGAGVRRRIFEPNGTINLSAETIKEVVKILEKKYLFGIDADLNGRLFETFLSATMRGKDLGQYFTPRSIVKLGVRLARIKVDVDNPERSERVYDGCCGTGGFLIDVLADMWAKIDAVAGKTPEEKTYAKDVVKNSHIWGCEVGKDPNLARIARLNMYLHGDGGATIFNLDGLDKKLDKRPQDSPDQEKEKNDFSLISKEVNGYFDVVVTNPPFAKSYKLSEDEDGRYSDMLLRDYELLDYELQKKELRSNLMFTERYYDLLKPGGRIITVLDDGILSGDKYAWFRRWIYLKFIVKAVVSLPGDAFQRSKARVKTSLLVLQKKSVINERQCNVFMYPCRYVGLDDPSRARSMPIDAINRKKAKEEIALVAEAFEQYCTGKSTEEFIVHASRITDRLDVKHCLIQRGSSIRAWQNAGLKVVKLKEIVDVKKFSEDDVIDCQNHDDIETYLRVTYAGEAHSGDDVEPSTTQHQKLYVVREGDIAISNIAATYGSVGYIGEDVDGCVASNEYTILTSKANIPPRVLWVLLRSEVFRSEMLLAATGANRTRIRWSLIKNIEIPLPNDQECKKLNEALIESEKKEKAARQSKERAVLMTKKELILDSKLANTVLDAFKPPK
ncbi:N-6 DNA methylase [Candidatus Roizmanbacteria bacterium]|nr:N-6 DNA methylase [Candidatus Roizmanbacteria bacterium]